MKVLTELIMIIGVSALAFLSGSDSLVHAKETRRANDSVSLQEGTPFLKARSRLIKSGWKPISLHTGDGYEYVGEEKRLINRHFFEVDSCSTDRGSLCILYYAKGGKCLRLDTVGEQVEDMRVTRWDDSCPNEPPKSSTGERRGQ